jgi:hypothetical protein
VKKRSKRLGVALSAATLVAAVGVLGAPSAEAAFHNYTCTTFVQSGTNESVQVCQAFDQDTTNPLAPRVRGFGQLIGSPLTKLHISLVSLRNSDSAQLTSGTADGFGYTEAYTGFFLDDCRSYYMQTYFSIQWPNGVTNGGLLSGVITLEPCVVPVAGLRPQV